MINIAVDGHSASGKGVICKRLAEKLGIIHFDTGAIYRVIGLYIIQNDIDPNNEKDVIKCLKNIKIDVKHNNGEQETYLNGKNASNLIRTREVSEASSITSAFTGVREYILDLQRDEAKRQSLIMEGRDITSHVLPNADFKFFLTATLDVRAKRRYLDLINAGTQTTIEEVKNDLAKRDKRDSEREVSPLILVEDAIYIDNSEMTIEEEVDLLYKIIKGEG